MGDHVAKWELQSARLDTVGSVLDEQMIVVILMSSLSVLEEYAQTFHPLTRRPMT